MIYFVQTAICEFGKFVLGLKNFDLHIIAVGHRLPTDPISRPYGIHAQSSFSPVF